MKRICVILLYKHEYGAITHSGETENAVLFSHIIYRLLRVPKIKLYSYKNTLYHIVRIDGGHENTLQFVHAVAGATKEREKNNRSPSEFDSLNRGTSKGKT